MRQRTIYRNERELLAGVFSCADGELVAGCGDGIERYAYPELLAIESVGDFLPGTCHGLQHTERGLAVLLNGRDQSNCVPCDFATELWVVEAGRRGPIHSPGPGIWQVVRGGRCDLVVLAELVEGKGIRAIDASTGRVLWSQPAPARSRVVYGARGELLVLGDTLRVLSTTTGAELAQHALPEAESVQWTAVARCGTGWLLGGYHRLEHDYCLARWCPAAEFTCVVMPMVTIFPQERITKAWDDVCCGIDLFEVAAIEALGDGTAVVVFGGNGEYLGACQGACALARLSLPDLTILECRILDDENGAAGVFRANDGAFVVGATDCIHVCEL